MDEGECPATLIDQFLDQFKDNKYKVTITNLRMDSEKSLQECIDAVRHHDLILSCNRTQEHWFTKIRRLAMIDDTSSVTKTSTYIEPEVWQGLSTDQRWAIIQSQEKKPPEQDGSKKWPNGASKNNRACRAKAARARRAKEQQKSPTNEREWQMGSSQWLKMAVLDIQAKEVTTTTHGDDITVVTSNKRPN